MTFPYAATDTNLGEPVADQISTGFRIFTQDPNNLLSQQQWTAVGPAADNNGANSGPVNAIAVDPSDPSGNTVYVAAATGGLWKTTDFLTTSPNGPTYVPLINLGPTGSLNISSIAIVPENNAPNQSVIYAMTGNPNDVTEPGDAGNPTNSVNDQSKGIGLLQSTDGGKTWNILDSIGQNFSGTSPLPESSPLRDHDFVGLIGYKVVVDPTPLPGTPYPIIYAAFSNGPTNTQRRPLPEHHRRQHVDASSRQATPPTSCWGPAAPTLNGNLVNLYAAFQGNANGTIGGVYGSTSAFSVTAADGGLTLLAGDNGDQSVQNVDLGYKAPADRHRQQRRRLAERGQRPHRPGRPCPDRQRLGQPRLPRAGSTPPWPTAPAPACSAFTSPRTSAPTGPRSSCPRTS